MDNKSWLWRKKSSEKMIVANDKVNVSPTANEEEMSAFLADKAELENELKNLNDKLSSVLCKCSAKDDLVQKHEKMAQEAMAGWEKSKEEVRSLKQDLEEALQKKVAGEERLTHLDLALKECMQQLRFVREEQEQRIHDAVLKASKEYEKAQMILEEKLAETNKRLGKISLENTHISKALLMKEKSIEDLSEKKAQIEADYNALMSRLESTEKENASLKYEVRVLEKELEIRNEEKEFNRRTADVSHKQHLESVKKIAKLESECQRLRVLVRKRLPGPAALAKMKSEVEGLGRDSVEVRRIRSNSVGAGSAIDNSPDTLLKKINFLTEQYCALEEENKSLKEALNKKGNELQFSRAMYARTASRLSQVESRLDELSKGHTTLEPSRSTHDLSMASKSDIGSDDKASCAESWASALISELEHFKHGKQRASPSSSSKTVGASDLNLLDDFVEMERLAISVDKPSGSPHPSSDGTKAAVSPSKHDLNGYASEMVGKEIIPVLESGSGASNQEIKSKFTLITKSPGWLQDILKVVLAQSNITQRKPEEILEDVQIALASVDHTIPGEHVDVRESLKNHHTLDTPQVGGYISWKSVDNPLAMDSSSGKTGIDTKLTVKSNPQSQSHFGKSIYKIIELIEGITLSHHDKNTETTSGYIGHVFQWKASELSAVLQQFAHTCYDLLNGKSDINRFAQEVSSALDWIMNHCFSLQDVSSMRETIKKQFDWDESRSESEAEVGMIGHFSEHLSYLPVVAVSNGHQERDDIQSRGENKKSKDELVNVEYSKKDLEERLQSEVDKSESLMNQLRESEKTIAILQAELATMKESKQTVESQFENQKQMKEDLDTQLSMAKAELSKAREKLSSLEVELENKSSCCEELETACLELQLQLESVSKMATSNNELHQEEKEEKQLRTDLEITAASERLAECQETILNLGKQLKALAPPKEAALFDKVFSTPAETTTVLATTTTTTTTSTALSATKNKDQRSSLLHHMLAEDDAKTKGNKSSKINRSDKNSDPAPVSNEVTGVLEKILMLEGAKHHKNSVANGSLAIVPRKKRSGGNIWRKLLWRKRRSSCKKPAVAFAK